MFEIDNKNSGTAVSLYNKLRDQKEAMEKAHKANLKPINEAMRSLEDAMAAFFLNNNLQNIKLADGAGAYQKHRKSATVQDKDEFLSFVTEQDEYGLLEVRANANAVEEYMEEFDDLPPGVKFTTHTQIIFTR